LSTTWGLTRKRFIRIPLLFENVLERTATNKMYVPAWVQCKFEVFYGRTFTVAFLLFSLSSFGQSDRVTVKDTAVIDFMTWLLKGHNSFVHKRNVDRNVRSGYFDFEYDAAHDSVIYHIDTIKQKIAYKWELKIKGVKLVNERIGDYHPKHTLWSYSLPMFSLDKRYVIIQAAFYCGIVCGGGGSELYKRENGNTWIKVKQLDEWAE
jgi:hypothetical protein